MKGVLVGLWLSLAAACMLASAASADAPQGWPSISASFSPSTVSIGDTTELTITLSGGDGPFSNIEISSWFPTGLSVPASSSSQCGGTLTTTPPPDRTPLLAGGATEVTLSGASLAPGDTCSFSVPVTAESAGQFSVGTSVSLTRTTSDGWEGYGHGTTAALTVPAIAAPALVKSAFTPSTVPANGTTTWTVQIANPNTSTTLTDVRFFVVMPLTAAYILPEAVPGNSCGGNVILNQGFTVINASVNYGGGSIAPGAQCAITVTMSPESPPYGQAMVPLTVVSNEGGTSAVSEATFTSLAPPPPPPPAKTRSNTFTHTQPKITRNGTIRETVKLPGKGTVRLRETWRGKLIAHFEKTVKTRAKLTIRLVPSTATRLALKSHHAATLKLSVAYTPTGGRTRTATLTVRTPR